VKPATVSRRAARALVLEIVRNLPREEFGECELCGFTHNRPLERTRCPLCGGDVCLGEPACGCGDSVRGGEYNVTHQTSAPATRLTSGSVASQRR
jgi:hypothetical protein